MLKRYGAKFMKIAVSVESTNDLTKELLQTYDIKVIPFGIVLKDRAFKDGELSASELFKFVDECGVLPKTNAINEFEYTEFFEELKKEYDAVIHVALSSGLLFSCFKDVFSVNFDVACLTLETTEWLMNHNL